ncbi:hypothetical protein, partial [Agromyces binzhouensis]|uniref:hypothetical protein n=1 Tax=Agromyces binzhouensis TaxID=1817495 RepID=UPI003BF5EB05
MRGKTVAAGVFGPPVAAVAVLVLLVGCAMAPGERDETDPAASPTATPEATTSEATAARPA